MQTTALAMRHILINHARNRAADKRGGGARHLNIEDTPDIGSGEADALVEINEALQETERAASALRQVRALYDVRIEDDVLLIESEALAALNHVPDARSGAASALASALRHDGPLSTDLDRAQSLNRRFGARASR